MLIIDLYNFMQESWDQPLIKLSPRSKFSTNKTAIYNLMSNAVRIYAIKQNLPLHVCILKMHTVPQYSNLCYNQEIRLYIEAKLRDVFTELIRPSENMIITTDRFEVKKKMIKIVYGNTPIELWLQRIHSFCEKSNSSYHLRFFNSIINNILKQYKYSSNQQNNFFFKPILNTVLIPNLFKIQGFQTSLRHMKDSMLLFLKDSKKYLNSKTILEEINEFYYQAKSLQKQQRRIILNQLFKNQQIMCQYGENKIYILEAFVFDVNINSICFYHEKMNISLKDYYYDKYNLRIGNMNQPLIKVYGQKQSYFIPEFMCKILKSNQLKGLQKKSSIRIPQQSLELQQKHTYQILSYLKDRACFPTFFNYKDLNITIQETLIKMKGVALEYPTIRTAKGQIIDIFQGRAFEFQGKSVFQCERDLNICIICPTSIDINQLRKDIIIATDQVGVNHNLVVYTYGLVSSQRILDTIKQMIYIERETERKCPTNMYWIILPKQIKSIYSPLKRITLDQSIGAITQITMSNVFESGQKKKIIISIIQQMVAKIQGKLWIVENKFKDNNILMIGIYSKMAKNGETILSFCSNTDPYISQFNSRFHTHRDGFNISQHVRLIVMQAIQNYLHISKSFPQEIIILRNQHQLNELQQNKEMQQIMEGIKNYYVFKPNKPGISYLTVRPVKHLKLSLIKSNGYSRPFHGLLISTEIVQKDDFILVNEFLTRNSYVYYRKLYKNSKISFDEMAELLYHQTFNYYNFQGGVSVPAILKYAQKQSYFIAKLEHLISLDHASNLLYFL